VVAAPLATVGRPAAPARPEGIGLGVAFDWALIAQFVTMAVAAVVDVRSHGLAATGAPALLPLLYLAATVLPFALGEGLRRGHGWAWRIQLVANGLLTLGGLLSIPSTLAAVGKGDVWPLIPTLVLVILSPLIVWRLSRPSTRAWIARGDRAEALRRHGGAWLLQVSLPCAIGGILVGLANLYG